MSWWRYLKIKYPSVIKVVTLTLVFQLTLELFSFTWRYQLTPLVFAANGDFATFEEAGGGTVIDPNGAPLDVTWDTTVDSNSNLPLQANSSDVQLTEGGKYLVLYNVAAHEGSAGGTLRRSLNSYLTVAGTPLAYGRGAGYIRDTEALTMTYLNGGAFIEATSGDLLQVHIARDDTNTTAGTEIKPGTNGVSVIKMPDGADYLRARVSATSSDISGNTAFTSVAWDTADEVDTNSFAFTPTSANLTLKGQADSHFIVNVNVGLYVSGGGTTRQNYEMRLTLDGTEIPGTRTTSYLRGRDGTYYGQLVYTGLIAKTAAADQTLNVEVRRESSGGAATVIMGDKTGISIMKVEDTAQVVRLTDVSGTQTTSNVAQALTFDTETEIDTGTFTHSTGTNPERITVNSAGDYLFFATAYTETVTSGQNRQPFRVNWLLNGGTKNRSAFWGYNRANTSFTAGASGAILLSGLSVSDYVNLTQIDESNDAPVDATFPASRIAIQGVLLDDNFYGLDVVVSATGTMEVDADIPTVNFYTGGKFVIQEQTSSRNVTSVTITESGTVDGNTGLDNIKLYYDLDTTAPYDCASESYNGTESQYGSTDTTGFSGADGDSIFSDSVTISTTQALCLYPVLDITGSSTDGETIKLSIDNPSLDVVVTGGGSVGPVTAEALSGSTTLRNAELTQIHYQWLNDDGVEGAATSINGSEDSPASGFQNGTIRRLRMQVAAKGSTSSHPTSLRLEYAEKTTTCAAATTWYDAQSGPYGGMSTSTYITDGADSSDLTVANGGTTNENTTFLTPNGALRDINSQTDPLTFTSSNFLELEYAIEPSASAPQGTTFCFRLTDAGTPLRNYDIYPEATISSDIYVSATGSQISSVDVGTANQYLGGAFVIQRSGTTRTLTDITLTETGTVDAANNLSNIKIFYDLDTTAPYDCASESYAGTEPQFGVTDTDGFSSANGTSTFSGSVNLSSTQTMCAYVVLDVGNGVQNGETINVEINDPSSDVVVTSSTVGPSTVVSPTGSTTVNGPVLTQTHYHWRNDDGSESGATSATGGVEDTALTEVAKQTTYRLRLEVSNAGSVTSAATSYKLEYGTKVSTCDAITNWTDVGAVGGAFDMSLSPNIADGDTTNITSGSLGAVTDSNTTFVGTGALRESSSDSGLITLSATEFTELEYAIEATADSGYDTTYCFRVSDAGTDLPVYNVYPELTTRPRQDFFIQRGDETVSGTGLTLTAGVDYTAPAATSSAFVFITNSLTTGAGNNTGLSANQNADDVTAYISDQSDLTSSFTISRPVTAIDNTRVSWEMIEFTGLAGSDNEMIVRSVGQLDVPAGNFYATGTAVSGVNDDNDVVVFITGQLNNDTARANYNDGFFTAAWSSATQQPVFTRGDADTNVSLSYAVVEFTGANWQIQRVEHTYTAAGVIETEAITAIPNVSQGFVYTQKRTGPGLNGLDEQGHQVWLSSLGAVSFKLRSGADTPSGHVSVAWVIANTQSGTGAMVVHRSSGTIASGSPEPNTVSLPIGATVRTSNSSIFATNDSNGTGTYYPRVMNGFSIASSTNFEIFQSDTGQPIDFRVAVVEWPVAETSVRQNYYRFYVNNDQITPTDPWPVGAADLGENTTVTAADDPLGEGETIRLRMSLYINNATLPAETKSFKLQYGLQNTTCSAITSWFDVGAPGSAEIWRGYDATPIDGTEVATGTPAAGTLLLTPSDVAGTYEEQNNSAVNPYAVDVGQDVEYDWVIQHNGAAQRSDYCFRVVNSDGTEIDGYINYPVIRTTGYTPLVANWRWYGDETNETPVTALAAENVAPINIANQDVIKLRVRVDEVENAAGSNVKFYLQYSQYADFSDGGTTLVATSSCLENSIWCYADGAGVDNVVIQSAVLSGVDSCSGGVGNGCGTHNEAATTTTTLTQAASSKMEFEYTLRHAGARANGVYYFRLVDANTDQPLAASSSYPSLVTEGAQLVSTVSGVGAGASIAGIITDATTTPTAINFGSLPFNTSYEAAQQISVNTNATEGYQLFMYADSQLINSYGDEIPPITATNAAPAGWGSACLSTATGCFGYHTTDAVLENGSGRFAPDDSYAALSTTTAEVAYSSIPTNDANYLIFRVLVTENQPAGDYSTKITFISIPVF